MQQPLQFVWLQVEPPVHTPPAQLEPFAQEVQVAPLTPHDRSDWPVTIWHVPLEQQPAQLKKSHATVGEQMPEPQELFGGHAMQLDPPEPHCDAF